MSPIKFITTSAHFALRTEALVSEIPEEKKEPAMPPGGGMGGMY